MKTILLICLLFHSICCFPQTGELRFIVDSVSAKKDMINDNWYDYYDGEVIRCKTFYNYPMNPVHFEFIKIGEEKYYCLEFAADGSILNKGVARKESRPYDELKIPIIDSAGNVISEKKILDYYKLYRDEFWKENIDSGYTYAYGKYVNGKRDSTWITVLRGNVEKEILYRQGEIANIEIVNITANGEKKIREILAGKWELIDDSFSQMFIEFKPYSDKKNTTDYLALNANGTYKRHYRVWDPQDDQGKWKLTDNGGTLQLFSESNKAASQKFKINYISKYGLKISFFDTSSNKN